MKRIYHHLDRTGLWIGIGPIRNRWYTLTIHWGPPRYGDPRNHPNVP